MVENISSFLLSTLEKKTSKWPSSTRIVFLSINGRFSYFIPQICNHSTQHLETLTICNHLLVIWSANKHDNLWDKTCWVIPKLKEMNLIYDFCPLVTNQKVDWKCFRQRQPISCEISFVCWWFSWELQIQEKKERQLHHGTEHCSTTSLPNFKNSRQRLVLCVYVQSDKEKNQSRKIFTCWLFLPFYSMLGCGRGLGRASANRSTKTVLSRLRTLSNLI